MTRITDMSVKANRATLRGTFLESTQRQTSVAVLMLHGSGPLDRDANMPGQKLDIFNSIAAALDRAGVSSYRYDKRGCGESSGDYSASDFTDLIEDACAATQMLVSRPDIGGVVVLGHSEGTMIAPVVAHLRPEVVGMILLSPTIQPVEDTLMRQAEHMADMVQAMPGARGVAVRFLARLGGGFPKAQRKLITRIKTSKAHSFRLKGQTVPARPLKELLSHDPKAAISKVRVPMLAISGAKDIQCLPGDADLIAQTAQGPVESHCLSDLTHLLRADTAPASFDRYNDLMKKDLDPRVLRLCADWILKQAF